MKSRKLIAEIVEDSKTLPCYSKTVMVKTTKALMDRDPS